VANIDHKDGADLTTENIKIRDIQPDVLASYRRIEMVRHGENPRLPEEE
jgi:hypothetical protein